MGKIKRKASCFLLVLVTCLQFLVGPITSEAAATTFRIIGYLPDYDTKFIEATIDFSQLTDVNYFAIVPQEDGKLKFTDSGSSEQLTYLVQEAHKENVRVGISIGGWGLSDNFALATNEANQGKFIKEIVSFVKKYQLDTVDIDWEYPEEVYADQFVGFIKNLNQALGGKIGLSICVPTGVASNGNATGRWETHFKPEALREADWVNIMAYDAQVEGSPHHSPAELQKNSMNYWNELMGGNQGHKLVGGIPFYGKAENGAVITYSKIAAEASGVPTEDSIEVAGENYYFNSKLTVQKKVQDSIDLGAYGVMIWAPTQDTGVKSSNRLMDVVVDTIKANNVSLDQINLKPLVKSKVKAKSKVKPLILVAILLILGFLFFKGQLLFLLPKQVNGKKVKLEPLAKVVGVFGFFLAFLTLLFVLLPTLVVLIILLMMIVSLYFIMRT